MSDDNEIELLRVVIPGFEPLDENARIRVVAWCQRKTLDDVRASGNDTKIRATAFALVSAVLERLSPEEQRALVGACGVLVQAAAPIGRHVNRPMAIARVPRRRSRERHCAWCKSTNHDVRKCPEMAAMSGKVTP